MSVPAGWYDDGSGRQRWWDGEKWTEHFAPQSEAAAQPADAPEAAASSAAQEVPAADAAAATADNATADATPAADAAPGYVPPAQSAPEYAGPGYAAPGAYPGAPAQQPYGAATYPPAGPSRSDASASKKAPILGYIGLGLAVVGTILACIPPIVSGFGFFLLFAAFVVSLVGLFIKFTPKWPAIAGLVLSIVGGILGAVLTFFFVVNFVDDAIESSPNSSAVETEEPSDEETPDGGTGDDTDAAGRPSPEEITEGFLVVMNDAGITDYDDPTVSACIGQYMYDSDLSNETLTTIAGGQDVYEPADEVQHLTEVTTDAILACHTP